VEGRFIKKKDNADAGGGLASVAPCFHSMKKLPTCPASVWSIPFPFVTAQLSEEGWVNQGKL